MNFSAAFAGWVLFRISGCSDLTLPPSRSVGVTCVRVITYRCTKLSRKSSDEFFSSFCRLGFVPDFGLLRSDLAAFTERGRNVRARHHVQVHEVVAKKFG